MSYSSNMKNWRRAEKVPLSEAGNLSEVHDGLKIQITNEFVSPKMIKTKEQFHTAGVIVSEGTTDSTNISTKIEATGKHPLFSLKVTQHFLKYGPMQETELQQTCGIGSPYLKNVNRKMNASHRGCDPKMHSEFQIGCNPVKEVHSLGRMSLNTRRELGSLSPECTNAFIFKENCLSQKFLRSKKMKSMNKQSTPTTEANYLNYNRKLCNSEKVNSVETPLNLCSVLSVAQKTHSSGDFRESNLFFKKEDIEFRRALKKNIIKGSFLSVDQYLDTQFYLLREDFIGPLREDLAFLSAQCNKGQDTSQIKVYKGAKFIRYEVRRRKCGILVKYEPKVKYQTRTGFMQGSLLVFSNDNFKNYFFATVIDHTKKGEVIVKMCEEHSICDLSSGIFTMIEPVSFFEPYFHVMRALQCLNELNFPMKRYIINGDCHIKPPAYLVKKKSVTYKIGHAKYVPILDLASPVWPNSEELKMDDSQYKAFRAALTQEFVVVQGPPGTGKTFLGLKVAETLLNNEKVWYQGRSPIMVVCYTNHALDQFLEGLLGVTKKIVRVGGQSRSQVLQPFNLKNQGKTIGWGFTGDKKDISRQLHDCVNRMTLLGNDLTKIDQKLGIISLDYLFEMGVVTTDEMKLFGDTDFLESCKQNFLTWLLCDDGCQNEHFNICEMNSLKHIHRISKKVVFPAVEERLKDIYYELEYYLKESELEFKIMSIQKEIEMLKKSPHNPHILHSKTWVLEELNVEMRDQLSRLQFFLSKEIILRYTSVSNLPPETDVWQMNCCERWSIYKYWEAHLKWKLKELQNITRKDIQVKERDYQMELAKCSVASLQKTQIFGMTTTGAARNQQVLQMLKPKIVIVEEAAEVMESHIIASLTPHCEHLILIGDHQQLRPNINVHELRLNFGFDVSLFERMINNGMNCATLKVQHRMRPEISSLIVPTIYPELLNHNTVYNLPSVMGMTSNVYFVTHNIPEEKIKDNSSHKNVHEATFLIMLCRHLLLQGYFASDITIITTYKAQMNALVKERERDVIMNDVRISTVDDFQGEESKIILLSLVRSNAEGNIGFLRIENRICVALSRAQEGFYMIGNMGNLAVQSQIWHEVNKKLIKQGAIGSVLLMRCQNHPQRITSVSSAEHFMKKVPEGGCNFPCNSNLVCGHKCPYRCHVIDREHKARYRCRQVCSRIMCPEGHKCLKECWEECNKKCGQLIRRTLRCGHQTNLQCYINWNNYECRERVMRTLPCCHVLELSCFVDWQTYECQVEVEKLKCCGHTIVVKCFSDVRKVICPSFCKKQLPCGHKCENQCHPSQCGICTVPTEKAFPNCGHKSVVPCHEDISKMKCIERCEKVFKCGHQCTAYCGDPCLECNIMIKQITPSCGHEVFVPCGAVPSAGDCHHSCERKLDCGHKCTALCNEPCVSLCKQLCVWKDHGVCGHEIEVPCYKQGSIGAISDELLGYCQASCGMKLQCGHVCRAKCSKCLQGRIHCQCTERCGKRLICGHSCDAPCYLSCPPCPQKYTYVCSHNQRVKRCFKKLEPCMEQCDWKCEHYTCTRLCGDLCNRPACTVACKELLPCGHPCIGFCGDPCPPLCMLCHSKELAAVPGFVASDNCETESNLRFVLLVDCNHTMESNYLEERLTKSDPEIQMKSCPFCEAAIVNTPRYKNSLKMYFMYETEVKALVFKKKRNIENRKSELVSQLMKLKQRQSQAQFNAAIGIIIEKSHHELFDAETLQIETCIVSEMENKLSIIKNCAYSAVKWKAVAYVETLMQALASRGDHMSGEEKHSWHLELCRLRRIAELTILFGKQAMDATFSDKLPVLNDVTEKVFSKKKYSKELDHIIDQILSCVALQTGTRWPKQYFTNVDDSVFLNVLGMCEHNWFKSNVQLHTETASS